MGLLCEKRADIFKCPIFCKFSQIGWLIQKRGHIFKFAIFLQSTGRNNELLEISVFWEKGEENNNLTKYSHSLFKACVEKGTATINLPKLVCVVNNIQETDLLIKIKLLRNTLRNCGIAWNWRQNTLRNSRLIWNLPPVIKS